MTFCRTEIESNGESWTVLFVVAAMIRQSLSLLVSRLTVDILSILCDGLMVQCVNLMLRKILQFDCGQNVTCLKRFTRYVLGITQVRWKT